MPEERLEVLELTVEQYYYRMLAQTRRRVCAGGNDLKVMRKFASAIVLIENFQFPSFLLVEKKLMINLIINFFQLTTIFLGECNAKPYLIYHSILLHEERRNGLRQEQI